MSPTRLRALRVFAVVLGLAPLAWSQTAGPKRLEPADALKLQRLRGEALTPDGKWLGYVIQGGAEERGFGEEEEGPATDTPRTQEVVLIPLDGGDRVVIKDGGGFSFSEDSAWVFCTLRERPAETTRPAAEPAKPAAPEAKPGEEPAAPAASEPAQPAAQPTSRARGGRRGPGGTGRAGAGGPGGPGAGGRGTRGRGQTLIVQSLRDGTSRRFTRVEGWTISKDSRLLAFVHSGARPNDPVAVQVVDLGGDLKAEPRTLQRGRGRAGNVAWSKDGRYLTWFSDLDERAVEEKPAEETKPAAEAAPEAKPAEETQTAAAEEARPAAATETATERKPEPRRPVRLCEWERERDQVRTVLSPETPGFPKDRELARGRATWAPDRSRVFVTLRKPPAAGENEEESEEREVTTPGGRTIRVPGGSGRGRGGPEFGERMPQPATGAATPRPTGPELDVWHWKDQVIAPMKRRRRGPEEPAVLHVADLGGTTRLRALGDERLANLTLNEPCTWGVAADDDPWLAERTWDRAYADYWLVDTRTGARRLIGRHSPRPPRWLRDGSALLWFEGEHWFRIDPETLQRTNLTAQSDLKLAARNGLVAFDHEDDDGIGTPGRVLPGGREMLFSDGWDLWALPLQGGVARNLTRSGRAQKVVYTHLVLDDEAPFAGGGRQALVTSFDQRTKARGVHRLDLESGRLERLLVLDKELGTPKKAQNAERWVMTIEDGHQSPELWVAGADFAGLRRVTDANAWLKEYDLPPGELVEWRSADGDTLQGILIRPAGYEPGKRYPTIVHLYEKMSQQLHRFRGPGLGLNPQVWAQRGYAVLLPDIVYQIGRPGPSAVKCIVPAVQKLVDLGIADPGRVGICGHSWGGYETAYIITQTRIFAAAIAGAPVVNMTSAYNGIRWSTGIPRQFQYEQTQSRIGGTLWDYPELFIENSPIFHLRSVTTPVLIEFGNNDGAVPWYQGIEFYLGMRRLGKPAVLLEYKEEGHGLRRRPNREDYTKRTLEWWDHWLKGAPAADWIGGPTLPKSLEAGAAPAVNPTTEDSRK